MAEAGEEKSNREVTRLVAALAFLVALLRKGKKRRRGRTRRPQIPLSGSPREAFTGTPRWIGTEKTMPMTAKQIELRGRR